MLDTGNAIRDELAVDEHKERRGKQKDGEDGCSSRIDAYKHL